MSRQLYADLQVKIGIQTQYEIRKLMKNSFSANNRTKSLNALKNLKYNAVQSLADKNMVSLKQPNERYFTNKPLRILLPDFFNIPKFIDQEINLEDNCNQAIKVESSTQKFGQQKGLKKRLKDLSILAEGMKRAKNIREQSRYYFIQGVILYNSGSFLKSIEMFQKFLKIVLFIKDDKSIQLALNSIGVCYMYLNHPLDALQYHEKQCSLNESSQIFIGKINLALCYQMMGNKTQAYHIYCEAQDYIDDKNQKKLAFVKRLIQRTKTEKSQSYFMTQNQRLSQIQSSNKKEGHLQKQNKYLKKQQDQRLSPKNQQFSGAGNTLSKKKYQTGKVNFAIFNAEENINAYLKDMKNSFTIDH